MNIRGWVYVMSNVAFPIGVKIGYTLKDTELRAQELSHTGVPAKWVVDYEAYVPNPRDIEQQVHKKLKNILYNKEFFECTAEEAVAAIKEIAGKSIEVENYKKTNKKISDIIIKSNLRHKNHKDNLESLKREKTTNDSENIKIINQKYLNSITTILPRYDLSRFFIGYTLGIWFLLMMFTDVGSNLGLKSLLSIALGWGISNVIIEKKREKDNLNPSIVKLKNDNQIELKNYQENSDSKFSEKINLLEEKFKKENDADEKYKLINSSPCEILPHTDIKSVNGVKPEYEKNLNEFENNNLTKNKIHEFLTKCVMCEKLSKRGDWKVGDLGGDWRICPNCNANMQLRSDKEIENEISEKKVLNPEAAWLFETNVRP